jgi:hypothetical protein
MTKFICRAAALAAAIGAWGAGGARGAHQTDTFSPVLTSSPLPYKVTVTPYDFGPADLPTLHSYAAGHHDGKWILIGGRTNGMHGFDGVAQLNFPPQFQNREVWVVDPVARQSWSRSLADATAGLTERELNSLTPANNQFAQIGELLYMTGGYGIGEAPPGGGAAVNGTFDELSALDLPGLMAWAMGAPGTAKQHLRQVRDPLFRVTGGAMYEMGGRMHLVFGQDFQGNYRPPLNGEYTRQVRSFDIVDDGATLSFANVTTTTPEDAYRRRDLNIVPVMRPAGGGTLEEGLAVLSGVFTPTNGAWTVPVEIDAAGQPTMADPNNAATFKQSLNGYHSAKLGMFSEAAGAMHEILFGGISVQYFDDATQQIATDNNMPFVNDIASIVIDAAGSYAQHRIGEFPTLTDSQGKRIRFGANAELFLAPGIETYDNGVLKMDSLSGSTMVGYIFGGITTNGPHTRNVQGVTSIASDTIFQVVVTMIPEPGGAALAAMGIVAGTWRRRTVNPSSRA